MRLLNVHLGQASVVLHHLEGVVPQQPLQAEHVSPAAQLGDGKGVPEAMRMTLADLRHGVQRRD
jgi:hypothetical protein